MTSNEANEKYLEYLEGHIGNVKEAFELFCTLDIPFINENKSVLTRLIDNHDSSKYEDFEWVGYLHHFYPTCDEDSLKTEEFEEACRHHIKNNPHHWDYWIEDGKLIDNIDELEYKLYCVERCADWAAMSIQNNNTPLEWYLANKEHIIMPDYGYELCEEILNAIPKDYDLSFHGTRTDDKPERQAVVESVKDKVKDEYVGGDGYYVIELNDGWLTPSGDNFIWAKTKKEAYQILNQCFYRPLNESTFNEDSVEEYIKSLNIDDDNILNNYDNQIRQHYKYIRLVGRKINKAKYDNERNMLKRKQDFYKLVYQRLKDMKSKQEDKALNESTLLEARMSQLRNKTKMEDPARVKKSKNVKTTYIGMSKFGILNFKTTSESRNGYHYQTVEFQSLKPFEEVIKKNGKIMPEDVKRAVNDEDINVYCSDESFSYWAWYHQAYQNDYAYIDDNIPNLDKRLQAPKVNNVRLKGALCKHLYSVLEYITRPFVLLAISDDMNNFLNKRPDKYSKQTTATQNWYDAVKQWTAEDATEYLGMTREQIITDLSKSIKIDAQMSLDDFVDDLVKDAIKANKQKENPKLEREIADKIIDELDLEAEYSKMKPEEEEVVSDEENIE